MTGYHSDHHKYNIDMKIIDMDMRRVEWAARLVDVSNLAASSRLLSQQWLYP